MKTWGGKQVFGLGHPPRCNCPDCNAEFVEHNRSKFCECICCTYQREIGAPQPPVVPQPTRYSPPVSNDYATIPPFSYIGPTTQSKSLIERAIEKGKQLMGNINMCTRPGCNAFIRGNSLGYVDILVNTLPKTEREVIELCPACIGDVHALLNSEPVTPRQKGYDKPFVPGQEGDDVKTATDEQLAAELFTRMMAKAKLQIEGGANATEE